MSPVSKNMARKIERFYSKEKGNGLRAFNQARAGELLFTMDPFACTVSKKGMKTTCENCFLRKEALLRCSRCKIAHYCDASCQKQAWAEHKRECRCLQSCHPDPPSDAVRLVARVIFRLLDPSPSPAEELYSVAELVSHLTEMSEEKRRRLEQLCVSLRLYLGEEAGDLSQLPPDLDPVRLFARVTCNCFTISDGELQEVGAGLYPSMSLLNHDCQPNCVMMFEGKRLQLRASRDIQVHEEITISYTDMHVPSRDRKKQLQEQYYFLCQCARCTSADKDVDMLAGPKEAWRSCRDAIPQIEQLQSERNWEQVLMRCQALEASCGATVPDTNVYLLRLLDMAMDACINLGRWDQALGYGTRTLQPYGLFYTDPHPEMAVQLMRVGKLQHFRGRLKEAQMTLEKAYAVMAVTHGCEHAMTNVLRRMLEECQAEMGSD